MISDGLIQVSDQQACVSQPSGPSQDQQNPIQEINSLQTFEDAISNNSMVVILFFKSNSRWWKDCILEDIAREN